MVDVRGDSHLYRIGSSDVFYQIYSISGVYSCNHAGVWESPDSVSRNCEYEGDT